VRLELGAGLVAHVETRDPRQRQQEGRRRLEAVDAVADHEPLSGVVVVQEAEDARVIRRPSETVSEGSGRRGSGREGVRPCPPPKLLRPVVRGVELGFEVVGVERGRLG
jgi:hypothetical protein